MTSRLLRQRAWIACLYGLAVVLVQASHTHHAPSAVAGHAPDASHCGAGHEGPQGDDRDRGPVPALTSCAADCPSCDFVLNHQAAPADRDASPHVARSYHLPIPHPADPVATPARPRGRSPPAC